MKNYLGIASVIKDTNKLISPSEWRGARIGSFIKFKKDVNHYVVSRIEPLFYLVDFEKIDDRKIKINGDTGININVSDTVIITYKEWEVQTINSISNQGKGYKIGDVLTLEGGSVVFNIQDNLKEIAKLKVDNVDESGAILKVSIVSKGKYYQIPEGKVSINGGQGNSAQFDIKFNIYQNRATIERDVESVEFDGKQTTLTLNYNLPNEIKSGKVSVDKWEIFLSLPYIEGTRVNEPYEITRDFSPNLGLPLMVHGTTSGPSIFNSAIQMLDKQIKELQDRIKVLES